MAFYSETTALLAAAAFIAGTVDAIAGGGGLITLPCLLLSGLPPVSVLGTNKLQSLFGAASATIAYARAGLVTVNLQWKEGLFALIGSVMGASIAILMPSQYLQTFLPILLVCVALYFAFKPNLDDTNKARKISPTGFLFTIPPLIGLYDGLFGPGAGSFYMLGFVTLAGYGVLKATAYTKLLNLASNIGGFLTFCFFGSIDWRIGTLMGVCQFLGAQVGVRLAIRSGAKLIKTLLVIVCLALAIKLLTVSDNPLRQFFTFGHR